MAVSLGQFSCGVRGTVRLRAGKRTIGRRAYRAQAQRPVTVRVRLNQASRRRLARGGTLSVKVVVTANAGATHAGASVDTTIRRR